MTVIAPEAIRLWARVRQIQSRGDLSETDLLELRGALSELGGLVGYDPLLIEPQRVPADGRPWRWMTEPQHLARWELACRLAGELDKTLAAGSLVLAETSAAEAAG